MTNYPNENALQLYNKIRTKSRWSWWLIKLRQNPTKKKQEQHSTAQLQY